MLSGFPTEASSTIEEIGEQNKLLAQQNQLLKAHLKAAYGEIGQLKVELIQAATQHIHSAASSGTKQAFSTPETKPTLRKYSQLNISDENLGRGHIPCTSSSKSPTSDEGSFRGSIHLLQSCIDECSNEESVNPTLEGNSNFASAIKFLSPVRAEFPIGQIHQSADFKLIESEYRSSI